MSNLFASLFLFLPSDSRKTSDCLKFSGLPSFEQYQDVPCRSKNAGSTISWLRWSPKHFVISKKIKFMINAILIGQYRKRKTSQRDREREELEKTK